MNTDERTALNNARKEFKEIRYEIANRVDKFVNDKINGIYDRADGSSDKGVFGLHGEHRFIDMFMQEEGYNNYDTSEYSDSRLNNLIDEITRQVSVQTCQRIANEVSEKFDTKLLRYYCNGFSIGEKVWEAFGKPKFSTLRKRIRENVACFIESWHIQDVQDNNYVLKKMIGADKNENEQN